MDILNIPHWTWNYASSKRIPYKLQLIEKYKKEIEQKRNSLQHINRIKLLKNNEINENNKENDADDDKDDDDKSNNQQNKPNTTKNDENNKENENKKEEEEEEDEENEEEKLAPIPMNRQYSRFNSHFGINMNYENIEDGNDDDDEFSPKYANIKHEVLNCDNNISQQEWKEIHYRSELFLQTFEGRHLKSKKTLKFSSNYDDNDIKNNTNNNYIQIKKNTFIKTEYIASLMLYCNFASLRDELRMSYRSKHDISSHYNKFYNFGKLLYIVINAFGTIIINCDDFADNHSSMQSSYFFHCFSNPVLFKNLRCSFNGGPLSMTIIPSIVFTNMYCDEYKNGIIVEMDTKNIGGWTSNAPYYFDISIISNFAYECERLFYGNISLSIRNIIESDISSTNSNGKIKKFNYHSNYLNAITLLRMIIGDCNIQKSYYNNKIICERLTLLISLEINYRRMMLLNEKKNIKNGKNEKKVNKLVPEYVGKLFHSWCMNVAGIIVLKLDNLLKIQSRLQSYLLIKNKNNINEISLNYNILFQIFPEVTKILCYGIVFNEYLCQQFITYLLSDDYNKMNKLNKTKVNQCILQFNDNDNNDEKKWSQWLIIIKKYQNILNKNNINWIINAKPPKTDSLETPKISFNKKKKQQIQIQNDNDNENEK